MNSIETVAECAKLLGHAARITIVNHLIETDRCVSASELTTLLPLSRSTVQQHITALREGGLIKSVAQGAHVSYCIDKASFLQKTTALQSFLNRSISGAENNSSCDVTIDTEQRILFLCTGNSCRSQMAEAFMKFHGFGLSLDVHSAGTKPANEIHPLAIEVMEEKGISLEGQHPKSSKEFIGNQKIDLVIFVCSEAEKDCPYIFPFARRRIAIPFDDPAAFEGTHEEKLDAFRRVRDEIENTIKLLLEEFPRS